MPWIRHLVVLMLCWPLAVGFVRGDRVMVRLCGAAQANQKGCVQPQDLAKAIAPVQLKTGGTIATIHGRIVDFERGTRAGDPSDPATHDRIKLLAYSEDGRRIADAPVWLSTTRIYQVFHQFDDPSDLDAFFSNRHDLNGAVFGSEDHRNILDSLVDPGGDMGLYDGRKIKTEGLEEGGYTGYILHGVPPHHSLYTKWTMSEADPFAFSFVAGERISLRTVARARAYHVFADSWDLTAFHALELVCSFARVDPFLAPQSSFDAAKRARDLGLECRQEVGSAFFQAMYGRVGSLNDSELKVLPVDDRDLVMVALDLLWNEPSFRYYPWVQAAPDGSVYLLGRTPDEPNADLIGRLFELVTGPRRPRRARHDYSKDPEITTKGMKILQALTFGFPSETDEEKEFLELDRRYLRRPIASVLRNLTRTYSGAPIERWGSRRERVALSLMCKGGWGKPEDMIPFVEDFIDQADDPIVANNVGKLLGIIDVTADGKVVDRVNEKLVDLRKRRQDLRSRNDDQARRELDALERFFSGIRSIDPKHPCTTP